MSTTNADPARSSTQEQEAERARLGDFLGTWTLEGRQIVGPFGPDLPIVAVVTCEWLAGARYLISRFAGRLGDDEIACIEVTGHDAENHRFPTPAYDNNGDITEWELRVRDNVWTRTGTVQAGGAAIDVKSTTEFSDTGKAQTATWEYRSGGSPWQTFWEVSATKVA